jgi:membrane protease YdiL (CAAX protease family)
VFSEAGDIYAAPTLIYHYVRDHGYKPPGPFITALMAQPTPPSSAYFYQLAQASPEWRKTSHPQPEPVPNFEPFRSDQLAAQFPSDKRTNLALARTPEIRLWDIALLLVGGLIVGAVLGLISLLVARSFTDSKFVAGILAGTAAYSSWLLGYEWLAKARGWDSLQARFSKTRPKVLLTAAACGIGLILVLSAVDNLLRWLGIDVVPVPLLDILPRNLSQLIFALILIGIIGPLTEELLFRGLLLDWLKEKMNVWTAAVILSVIFSLLHANPFSLGAVGWLAFGVRFLLGFSASALTIKYRSLRPAFVMHATWNAIGCIASVLDHA